MLKRVKFDGWKFNPRASEKTKTYAFMNQIIQILDDNILPERVKSAKYNTMAVYTNQKNNNHLKINIDGFAYLNYSPKVNNDIPDDEIWIDTENVFVSE